MLVGETFHETARSTGEVKICHVVVTLIVWTVFGVTGDDVVINFEPGAYSTKLCSRNFANRDATEISVLGSCHGL